MGFAATRKITVVVNVVSVNKGGGVNDIGEGGNVGIDEEGGVGKGEDDVVKVVNITGEIISFSGSNEEKCGGEGEVKGPGEGGGENKGGIDVSTEEDTER